MVGRDVLTDARVSRMSRRLPYEKTGSPAYVRGTIVKMAFVAGGEAAACVAGDEEGAFPATVDEEPVSCTSGCARSWLRGRMLGISHVGVDKRVRACVSGRWRR
jgi:hypothetical protein